MQPAQLSYFQDKRCFFAAANGYTGFRSYFHELFPSAHFDRIFVLKGGPGTGKSHLMSCIGRTFEGRGTDTEWIFCGSDPSSVDGVILRRNKHIVAMLDGTAPHERDAVLAGTVDTLVNLADGWDETALVQQRNEIIKHTRDKTRGYQKAYEYLQDCLKYEEKIEAEIKNACVINSTKMVVLDILDAISTHRAPTVTTRAIGAFGRYGHVFLPTYEHLGTRHIFPVCHPRVRALFMEILFHEAVARGARIYRSPSPLSINQTDALFFPDDGISVLGYTPANECNTEPIEICVPTLPTERLTVFEELHRECLHRAQREFSNAAEAHTRLETIYSRAMDFSHNDVRIDAITRQIEQIFA